MKVLGSGFPVLPLGGAGELNSLCLAAQVASWHVAPADLGWLGSQEAQTPPLGSAAIRCSNPLSETSFLRIRGMV